MTIGIVGLGLIGGSLAKAYKNSGHTVLGYDKDDITLNYVKLTGVIDDVLDKQPCDLQLLAINPTDTAAYLEEKAPNIAKGALIIDCGGIKRMVCSQCFPIAERYGFTFVGGHPMAGSHNSGFKNSRANLFRGASMILVPPIFDDAALFSKIESVLKPVGFGRLTVTTAEKHDEIIAFSSQMAHVVSNAYVKSPTACKHKGFSAGSYKDLTRVARLNAEMWAELCMENNDFLVSELDGFIEELVKYKHALTNNDKDRLKELFAEGSRIKNEIQ